MGVFSNKITRDELKAGDHIYTWRNCYLYAHHGIFAGDGKVIHFTRGPGQEVGTGTVLDRVMFSCDASFDKSRAPCQLCGDHSDRSGVISSCLDCFLWGGELYRFEYGVSTVFFLAQARGGTCTLAASDQPEVVLHRASFLLENGFGVYNTFKNNCEDFAIYCKTELLVSTDISVGRSGQITSIVSFLNALVPFPLRFMSTSVSGLAVVRCGMYCARRYYSDIGIRGGIMKVPVESFLNAGDLGQVAETVTPEKLQCDLDRLAEPVTSVEGSGEKLSVSGETVTPEKLQCDLDRLAEPVTYVEGSGEKLSVSGEIVTPEKLQCDLNRLAEPVTSVEGYGEKLFVSGETVTPEKLQCNLDRLAEPVTYVEGSGEKLSVSSETVTPEKLQCDLDRLAEPVTSVEGSGETVEGSGEKLSVSGETVTPEKLQCDLDRLAEPVTSVEGSGEKLSVSGETVTPEKLQCDLDRLAEPVTSGEKLFVSGETVTPEKLSAT